MINLKGKYNFKKTKEIREALCYNERKCSRNDLITKERIYMTDDRELEEERLMEQRRRRQRQIRAQRRRRKRRIAIMLRLACAVVLLLLIIGIVFGVKGCQKARKEQAVQEKARKEEQIRKEEEKNLANQNIIHEAEVLAVVYDYDQAIALLKGIEDYEDNSLVLEKIESYEEAKAAFTAYDVNRIEHICFGRLIVDAQAVQASEEEAEQAVRQMTTDTFMQTLQQMYDEGYLLISIRDLMTETKDEEGNISYEKADLRLPAGRKPFVLSQEDASYPEGSAQTGYGSRMVLDADGNPVVEYIQSDGTVVTGAYDVVPCLEAFLEEHPDFAYKNARGILGLTGYQGVLGYGSGEEEACREVLGKLKQQGWELACNGYGNVTYASTIDRVMEDVQKWQETVGTLTGATDILLYPKGVDIDSWTDYDMEQESFAYLKTAGFSIFCNIDQENDAWVQIRSSYVRQARKNPEAVSAMDGEPVVEND